MIVLVAVFAMNASAAAVYVLNNTVEFQTGENPEIRDGHYELKKGDRYGSHIYFDVPSGGS